MLCVSLQIPVSCRAEGVIRRALGVPLPVTPGRGVPNGRGTNMDGFFHTLPTVTVGAHPQGNHGVHAGIVLNGQMPADIFQMRIISGFRVAGPHARHWECPTLGLALLGGLRVLMINPSGPEPAPCRTPGAPQTTASPGDSRHLPADVWACGSQSPAHGGGGCSRRAFCRRTPDSGVP